MKLAHALVTASISLALSLAALGCSKGSGAGSTTATSDPNAPKGGSCMQSGVGLCSEYADNMGGIAEGACTTLLKGTYSKGSCSRDNSIGSCQAKDEVTYYYFGNESGPWTEAAADECKTIHEGTFKPTPGAAETAKQKALPTADHILASCVADTTSCEDHYGDPIKLQLYITDDPTTFRLATAKVVRVEDLTPGDAGQWLRRVGVQFDEPISMYAADVAAFHERALRLGLK